MRILAKACALALLAVAAAGAQAEVPGSPVLTAMERSEDMKAAIRTAVDKLERQLVKYKDKLRGFEHERALKTAGSPDLSRTTVLPRRAAATIRSLTSA